MNIDFSTLKFSSRKTSKNSSNPQKEEMIKEIENYKTNKLKNKSVSDMHNSFQKGIDYSKDREELILLRTKKALKDAQEFCAKHPEVDFDDLFQDLALLAIQNTDIQIEGNLPRGAYHHSATSDKKALFASSLEQNDEISLEECKDMILPYKDDEVAKINNEESKEPLMEALSKLTQRYREVIMRYYGLETFPTTLRILGEDMNCTKQRVSTIKKIVCKKLAESLKPETDK